MIELMGLAARAIARRRAEAALISELAPEKLEALDALLDVDPTIGQTRFHWLRSAPDAPGASNLTGLTERVAFLRALEIDPRLQARIPAGRWGQMIREGDAPPAWLSLVTSMPVAGAPQSQRRSSSSARGSLTMR